MTASIIGMRLSSVSSRKKKGFDSHCFSPFPLLFGFGRCCGVIFRMWLFFFLNIQAFKSVFLDFNMDDLN